MLKTLVANLQLSSLKGPIYIFSSVDNTKLPCYTLPPMQHHNFFRNLPPLFNNKYPSQDVQQFILWENSLWTISYTNKNFTP